MSTKHHRLNSVNVAVNSNYEAPSIPLPEDVLDPDKNYTRVTRFNFSEIKGSGPDE